MKKHFLSIAAAICLLTSNSFAQKEFWNWHFGTFAGVNFSSGNPLAFTNSALTTAEGCATISDKNGNLLFYTDGIKVWNKNNIQMPNGFGLFGNPSSCQSAIVVPRPGSPNLYYVFTADAQAGPGGFCYSVVDMTLNAGLGDVTTKNVALYTPTCEKITAVKHANGCDIWVLSHHWGTANVYAYKVTAAGVVMVPVISNPGGQIYTGSNSIAIGYMKVNPQGTKVASASALLANSLELYDFNNATGVCSNAKLLSTGFTQTYGCEFSPDGKLLYGSSGTIYQFNATLATAALVNASKVIVTTAGTYGALQNGTNGKMYHVMPGGGSLSVINSPNTIGVGCGFALNTVSLAGKQGFLGLPSFITSWVIPPVTFTASPLCYGANTTFTISDTTGITSYAWNFGDPPSGANNTSALPFPSHVFTSAGTYSVNVIINYACKIDTLKNVFNIVVTPTMAVTTTSATCSTPGSATVTTVGGTGPYNYTWTPTAQTGSVATGLGAGIYSVQVKDVQGCINTATTNLGSNNAMTGTITSTSITCNGGATGTASIAISGGSGSYGYLWTPGGQITASVNGLTAGIYSVTVSDLMNTCTTTKTVQITQPPAVTLTAAASSPTACAGTNITLTGTASGGTGAGYTYTWTAGPTLNTYVVNQTGGSYTYTLTAADGNGCTKTTNISVNFINNPNLTTTSSTICTGQVASLIANGATSYVWMPGGVIGSTYTSSPLANTTMTVTGANGACIATATAAINVNTPPVVNIVSTNILCNGQTNGSTTANVLGSAPFTYTWSTFPVQNTATANNLSAGNYNVQVVDNFGCISTASANITQPTALSLVINSSTTSVCAGSPINLTPIVAGGNGAYSYVWTPGPTSGPYTVIEANAGNYNYSLTVTDANGCAISKNINLTYNPQPTVTATSATICAGGIAVLNASGANTYVWMPSGATGTTFTTNVSSNTNITVIGTAIGCTGQTSANIIVNPLPNVSASATSLGGCVPLCVDLKSSTSSNIVAYSWSVNNGGIGSGSITNTCFNVSGTYTVGLTVTDNNGCMNSANPINITAAPQPIADFNYDPIKPLASVDLVSFTDASYQGNIVSWNWYFMNNGQYTSQLQNPTFTYADAGEYMIALVVKNDKGCTDTILKSILVGEDYGIYVPNTFTPNGDGLNDIFYAKGFGIKKYEMQVYDRWGEKVFTSTDLNEAWDGTYVTKAGTKQIQEGVYTWRIKLTNVFGKSKELTGHVTLIK